MIVHNLTFICVNKKKGWTLGLDLNKCSDHDIPKCAKNNVLFSPNFDGDVVNEKIDTINVVVLAINFNVATMKLIFVIQIIIRCVLWIIGFFCNFYIEYYYSYSYSNLRYHFNFSNCISCSWSVIEDDYYHFKTFHTFKISQLVHPSMFLFSYLGLNFHAPISTTIFHYRFGESLVKPNGQMHGS